MVYCVRPTQHYFLDLLIQKANNRTMNDRQQRKTSINLKIAALSTIKGSPDMDLIGIQEDLNKHY